MPNKKAFAFCITVMHNDRMSIKHSPPSTRTTIPVDNEVLAVFQRLAKAANMSAGKAMGEWLKDTVEAAELMASTMERARAAPKIVTAELHAMMLGMADQTKELQDKYSKFKGALPGADDSGKRSAVASDHGSAEVVPPPCNTGGKLPVKPRKQGLPKGFPLPPAKVQAHANTNGVPPKAAK